jgi:hypothetical protein
MRQRHTIFALARRCDASMSRLGLVAFVRLPGGVTFLGGCVNDLTTASWHTGPANYDNDLAAAFDESTFKSRARDIASKGA